MTYEWADEFCSVGITAQWNYTHFTKGKYSDKINSITIFKKINDKITLWCVKHTW